jgi:hypothetical protein
VIGESAELLREHANRHAQSCGDADAIERLCPHGTTVAICCGACHAPVFVAVDPDRAVCHHVGDAISGLGLTSGNRVEVHR